MQKAKAEKLRKDGMSYRRIAGRLGVSSPTVMRWLGREEKPRKRSHKAYRRTVKGKTVMALINGRVQAKSGGHSPCRDSVEEIVARFKGRCECCGKKQWGLCLDHDHRTGKFRGWICRNCNAAIGQLGDNLKGVLNAVRYLRGVK